MQKLTAQFIESFYTLQQEDLLSSNFVEEVAMVEQLSTMNLTQDDSHYLENFIYKEIPKLQGIVNKTYSNDILPSSQLNKNETVEDSLIEQLKIVKGNFKSFFIQVFDDEKFKISANATLLNQRKQNLMSSSGTSMAPSLQTEKVEESFFKPIMMPTAQKLETIGQKILEDNTGGWQDNFKRTSESLLNELKEKTVPSQSTNKESQNNTQSKFEISPAKLTILFLGSLAIIALLSLIL